MEAPRQQEMEHKNADTKLDWERGGGESSPASSLSFAQDVAVDGIALQLP